MPHTVLLKFNIRVSRGQFFFHSEIRLEVSLHLNMADEQNHAIVYGGSGIIGWELVNQVLKSYPYSGSFSKITAVTNRPLDLANSFWPPPSSGSPELQLVSGIDLRKGLGEELAQSLKHAVADFQGITHVYYSGKVEKPGFHNLH